MNNQRWYGRPSDRGGDDSRQNVLLLLGVFVVFGVLLAWSHFGLSVSSVPPLPSSTSSTTSSAPVVVQDQTRHFLQCVDGAGGFWRASYLQAELSGPGTPNAEASRAICSDPLRRVK